MISSKQGKVTYTEIFVQACKAGLYADFRRMGSGVTALINDHNAEWYGTDMSGNDYHRKTALKTFEDGQAWNGVKNGKYDSEDCPPL